MHSSTDLANPIEAEAEAHLAALFHSARHLAAGATFLRVVAFVLLIAYLIGGLVIATSTDDDGNHPYVSLGVGVMLVAIAQTAVLSLLAVWARTVARDRLYFVARQRLSLHV